MKLTREQVSGWIQKAEDNFRHEDCATCECYLGFLAQMEIDGDQEARDYLSKHKPARDEIHACLGCDPCPPGILYSDYLRKRSDLRF